MKLTILVAVLAAATSAACSASDTTGTPAGPSPSTPSATSPAWKPAGELVYVALPADLGSEDFVLPVLHTINADGSGQRKLPLSAYAATWSHDGTRLLANGIPLSSADFWPWRPAVVAPDGHIVKLFRLPDLPKEVDNCRWTSDEKAMVCSIGGLVRIDLVTGKVLRMTTGEDILWDISNDGTIAYAHQVSEGDGSEDAELRTMGLDGSGRHRLTEYGEVEGNYDDSGGEWLPDGSAIVTATPDGSLVRVDAATGDLTQIPLDESLFASRPAVSPDGTLIAFEGNGAGQDIYVTAIAGGPVVLVAGTDEDERRPEWRPSA